MATYSLVFSVFQYLKTYIKGGSLTVFETVIMRNMNYANICNHTRWLRLWKKDRNIILEASDRPRRLLKDFRDIDVPAGVVILLGNQTKAVTDFKLRSTRIDGPKSHGEYHLYASYLHQSRPIIICDGDVPSHNRLPISCRLHSCHEAVDRVFMEEESTITPVEASSYIYQRLISPFADVICLFVEDVGGINSAIQRLNAWTSNYQLSSKLFVRPALILVVKRGQKKQMEMAISINSTSWSNCFQRIRVVTVSLSTRKLRSRSVKVKPKQCVPLRREILLSLDAVQKCRLEAGLLFSARHTAEFLFTASESAINSSWEPLNFIERSREDSPVAPSFSSHVIEFLRYFNDDALQTFALPHIASSIILDQYRPGMHGKRFASCLFSYMLTKVFTSIQYTGRI